MVFTTPPLCACQAKKQKLSENPSPLQKCQIIQKKAFNCELFAVYYAHEETRRDAVF